VADAIVLKMPRGMADKTALDPANSGTIGTAVGVRANVFGPPTNGAGNSYGHWMISAYGTQTDSQSLTAATYGFVGDFPHYTVAPTTYNYTPSGV